MRIFISTGEPSGDLHAANLVRALRKRLPDAEFLGFGGPNLERAGATVIYPLVDLAVMWFGRVLVNLHKFLALASQADRIFRHERPDAVVLIDYPGFHWWIAWRAKVRNIPVFFYVPPQIWAWAGWRVKKVRKYIDYVLCSLPFEPAWYHARGVPGAVYVGHPYFDELAERPLDDSFLAEQEARGRPIVALLPGSRTQEVTRNLPVMLRAAALLSQQRPEVRFVVACLHDRHRVLAEELVRTSSAAKLNIELHAARTAELIRLADVAWAVSGSVGLELMVEALPTVVLYTIRPFDLWVARKFIKSRFISIVNLLADAEVMPEYLTDHDVSQELCQWALTWLNDPEARERASRALAALRDRVAVPGASDRAAARIADVVLAASSPALYAGRHKRLTSETAHVSDPEGGITR
ncbi:MAG TPA: lipid-A-disaccharide synthase [Isosphaeraceae bacterium]|jgi:lipid-A-disaccharide synthase|nr:lipid-A-disaccharide synthase [Isosphaeraceae bacterium]